METDGQHGLGQSVRGRESHRPDRRGRRPLLRHDAGAARRGRDQGGDPARRRRLVAHPRPHLSGSLGVFGLRHAGQAQRRGRSEDAGGHGDPVAPDRGRRRVHGRAASRHHAALRLRLRRGQREGAGDSVLLDLRLRPDRTAGVASGDGPGAAGVHRHRQREPRRSRQPSASHRDLADRHVHRPAGLSGDLDVVACPGAAEGEAGPLSWKPA